MNPGRPFPRRGGLTGRKPAGAGKAGRPTLRIVAGSPPRSRVETGPGRGLAQATLDGTNLNLVFEARDTGGRHGGSRKWSTSAWTPSTIRRHRRRAMLRIGLPIIGVGLMVATILAIALYSDRANRDGALALSAHLLTNTLEQRVALALSAYLDPAVRAVRVARADRPDGTNAARLPLIDAFAASLLKEIAQVDDIGFADRPTGITSWRVAARRAAPT